MTSGTNSSYPNGEADLGRQRQRENSRGSRLSTAFFIIALALVAVATFAAIGAALHTYRADTRTADVSGQKGDLAGPGATVPVTETSDVVDAFNIGVVLPTNTSGRRSAAEQHWLQAIDGTDLAIELRHATDLTDQREALLEFGVRTDVDVVILNPIDTDQLTADVAQIRQQGTYVVEIVEPRDTGVTADAVVSYDPTAITSAIERARHDTNSTGMIPVIDGTGDSVQQVTGLALGQVSALVYLDGAHAAQTAISAAIDLRRGDTTPGQETTQIWIDPQIVTTANAASIFADHPDLDAAITGVATGIITDR